MTFLSYGVFSLSHQQHWMHLTACLNSSWLPPTNLHVWQCLQCRLFVMLLLLELLKFWSTFYDRKNSLYLANTYLESRFKGGGIFCAKLNVSFVFYSIFIRTPKIPFDSNVLSKKYNWNLQKDIKNKIVKKSMFCSFLKWFHVIGLLFTKLKYLLNCFAIVS